MVKRILVIGAMGTVGRQVVAQLLDRGAHVRALTRHPHRATLPREVELIRGDLTAPETMDVLHNFSVNHREQLGLVRSFGQVIALQRIARPHSREMYLG